MALTLYPYQERALAKVDSLQGRAGLFMEMGTGKTPTALTRASRQGVRHVMVEAPLAVRGVWRREIVKWAPEFEIIDLMTGPIKQRVAYLNRFKGSKAPLMILTNYEAYWRPGIRQALMAWKPQLIIADEGHRLKNRDSRQARFAHTMGPLADERLDLTGTPISSGNEDLFSQYRFIDPRVFGTRWRDFQDRYLIMGGYLGYEIIGYRYQEEVRAIVERTSFQISKSEALDLPEATDVIVPIQLKPSSRAKYEEFRRNAVAQVEGVLAAGGEGAGIALARIVLTERLRLHQIAAGHVKTEAGDVIDLSDEKEQVCVDLVHDMIQGGRSVVIFCRFLNDIKRLQKHFKDSCYVYHGDVSSDDRIRIEDAFARKVRPIIICQIQAGSLGIDLTAASEGIFYTTGHSLIDFSQGRDRLHRHGQTGRVTYYHLIVEQSVDESIYEGLRADQQIASGTISLDYARTLLR